MRSFICFPLVLSLFAVPASASILISAKPWAKREISVCFADETHGETALDSGPARWNFLAGKDSPGKASLLAPWTENLRIRVKQIITTEFTLQATGIRFIGWQTCREVNSSADVILFISTSNKTAMAAIGESGEASIGENQYVPLEVAKVKKPFFWVRHPNTLNCGMNCWDATVVHEFGHLAGFYHEHEHPEVVGDPYCKLSAGGKDTSDISQVLASRINFFSREDFMSKFGDAPDRTHDSRIQMGAYDRDSIMSYCNMWRTLEDKNLRLHLSPQDRRALRVIYSGF